MTMTSQFGLLSSEYKDEVIAKAILVFREHYKRIHRRRDTEVREFHEMISIFKRELVHLFMKRDHASEQQARYWSDEIIQETIFQLIIMQIADILE